MAWQKQKLETKLSERLKKDFEENIANADKYFGYYTSARDILISENIFNSINTIRKDLSDHGENHIMDVMNNAFKLLGKEVDNLEGLQIYFICMLILFHDVGNLTADRNKHHEHTVIREVYDHIRHKLTEFEEERSLVPMVASKHSGTSSDGSKDTIKELTLLPPHLFGCEIYSKKCAALLRLADELAEGPHRTSIFMNKYYNYPYSENSKIYHKYAKITKTNIDKNNERICLTYYFSIDAKNGVISEESHKEFVELFDFTIRRMLKVEAERKYCKYYCDWLEPFKKTDVTFNFMVENEIDGEGTKSIDVNPGFNQVILNDLVLPGEESFVRFSSEQSNYAPEKVFNSIRTSLNER